MEEFRANLQSYSQVASTFSIGLIGPLLAVALPDRVIANVRNKPFIRIIVLILIIMLSLRSVNLLTIPNVILIFGFCVMILKQTPNMFFINIVGVTLLFILMSEQKIGFNEAFGLLVVIIIGLGYGLYSDIQIERKQHSKDFSWWLYFFKAASIKSANPDATHE